MAHKKGLGSSRNGRDSEAQAPRREDLRRPAGQGRDDHRPPARHEVPPRPRHGHRARRHDLRHARGLGRVPPQRREALHLGRRVDPPSSDRGALATARIGEQLMFHDRARIRVEAGRGGDGGLSASGARSSCRRAAPTAATAAGAATSCSSRTPTCATSPSFRGRTGSRRGRGGNGRGARKHGADGDDVELSVPVGTQVLGREDELDPRRPARGGRARRRSRAAATAGAATRASRRRPARRRASPRSGCRARSSRSSCG